jgi:hypothetical protein
MTTTINSQEPTITYREPLTCDECGCFLSKHDDQCSQWAEPARRIPCEDWNCRQPYEILRTGPIFAIFHLVSPS